MAPKCRNPVLEKQIDDMTDRSVDRSFEGYENRSTLFQGFMVIPKKLVKSQLKRALVETCNENPVDQIMLKRIENIFDLEIMEMKMDKRIQEFKEEWGRSWVMAIRISKGHPVNLFALMRHGRQALSHRGRVYKKNIGLLQKDMESFYKELRSDKDLRTQYLETLERAEKEIASA